MATVGTTSSPSASATHLSPPLDTARIIKRLSDSRKAQVPYYTGWDTKPNSCLKLIADIESEESYKRKVILARACTVLEISQQRRKYLEDDEARGQENRKIRPKFKNSTPSPNASKKSTSASSTKVVVQSAKELEDYIRKKEGGYDHYRDFPDLADDEEDSTDLSLHCVDSPDATTSLHHSIKSLSLSPSSFHDLNISEIKSDSSRGDASSFRNKPRTSLKSALSSSTPVRSPGSTKRVHFECSDLEDQDKSGSTVPGRRSGTFSILEEEEYDDFGKLPPPAVRLEFDMSPKETPPCLYIQSPVHAKIRKSLDEYERQRIERWREDVEAKAVELRGHSDKVDGPSVADNASLDNSHEKLKLLFRKSDARRQNLIASIQQQQKLKELELDQEDKQLEATKKLEVEKRRAELEKEREAAELAAFAAAERQEKEKLQKQKEEEEAQLRIKEAAAAAEEHRVKEEFRAQEQELLKEQQQQQAAQAAKTASANANANSQQGVPPEFRNAVLQSDLYAYLKLQQRLEEIKEAVKDISSTNPRSKEFYFSAMKVVNTPINSISNLSSEHLQQKIYHFIQLLEGKSVYIGDSMKKPFVASSEPNGDLFVQNLLAFRFVKKSEAEITRGMSGLTPLANLGVQLIRRFPTLGILIRANFYKMCPFLVPLIYPRTESMTNEQYAAALGHEQLGGTERTIQQVLLERLGGYCTLYGIMVGIVERGQFSDLQAENANFFSLREVWRILVATMKLEPQVDVTCAVLLALLETSCDSLYKTFRSQFRKLMNQLSSTYLRKIRNITPPAQAASLTRLELFLEAQVPKLR